MSPTAQGVGQQGTLIGSGGEVLFLDQIGSEGEAEQ